MSLCPFAEKKLLPENNTQARIQPRAIIAHSAGGQAELYGWWMNDASKGLESHFWISQTDGRIVQYMDTNVRADANGDANSFAISIETSSTVQALEGWSEVGLQALIKLMDWICKEHNIPRRQMAHPTDSGLGWHIMFGAPGPWTKAKGKVCPGPKRIEQFKTIVIPTLAKGTAPTQPTKPVETPEQQEERELMAAKDDIIKELKEAIKAETERAKPFAVRRKEDNKVFVVTPTGKWHVPNSQVLNSLYYTGLIRLDKDSKPPVQPATFFEGIPDV